MPVQQLRTFSSPNEALRAAIDVIGSQTALARLLGVAQPSVWRWVHKGQSLPAEHVLKVEDATGVPKEQLRPDIYRDERTPELVASDILDRAAAPASASAMDYKR